MVVMMIKMIIMVLKDQTSDDDNITAKEALQDLWSPTGEANSQPVAMSACII